MSPLEKQFQLEGAILLYTNHLSRGGWRDEIGVFFILFLISDGFTNYRGAGGVKYSRRAGEVKQVAWRPALTREAVEGKDW